jgi:dihydroorotate dehydrogenase electron transfer subunit
MAVPLPTNNADGTRTAIVAAPARRLGQHLLWSLHLPAGLAQMGVSGRYFLARCGAITAEERANNWDIYLRRPLYAALHHAIIEPAGVARWEVLLPAAADPGYRWLAAQAVGTPINLLGPFGQGFTLQPASRNLLILADLATLPIVLGLSDAMLDRGGRVTLLLQLPKDEQQAALVDQLPIPVEVRLAASAGQWQEQLAETVRWADQIAVALPLGELAALRQTIQQHRFRLEAGFVQALVQADLLCGVGACLACVVPTRDDGYTRACVHGPVFDLTELV